MQTMRLTCCRVRPPPWTAVGRGRWGTAACSSSQTHSWSVPEGVRSVHCLCLPRSCGTPQSPASRHTRPPPKRKRRGKKQHATPRVLVVTLCFGRLDRNSVSFDYLRQSLVFFYGLDQIWAFSDCFRQKNVLGRVRLKQGMFQPKEVR